MARAAYLQRRGREDEVYTLVCDEFVRLGGVYVKFLQGVLLNSPVMKRWHSDDKLKVFESLDYQPIDIVSLLQKELPAESLSQISSVQPQPFAAGSFGQVYYGQHADGTPIVIKVLRPMVRELLQYDLKLLSLFSRFFVRHQTPNVDVRLDDAIRDFRRATLAETDYLGEARFASELYQAFSGHPHLVIPKTYLDLSTSHIIVQEFIGGISAASVLELQVREGADPRGYVLEKLGSDLTVQLRELGVALLSSTFDLPRIQGDPHPGNIRLLPDNKVALIDFGIAARAPANRPAFFGLLEEWSKLYSGRENIVGLFEQYMRFFVNDLYRALKKLTSLIPQAQGEHSLIQDVGHIIQDIFNNAVGTSDVRAILEDGRVMQVFNQIINKGNRFGFVMKFESSDVLRCAQTYMSTVEALGLRKAVLPYVFTESVATAVERHPELAARSDSSLSISRSLEIVNSWLERVASRDPALFQRLMSQLDGSRYAKIKKRGEIEEPDNA